MQSIFDGLPRVASADRRLYIGASEVAAILNLDPFKSGFGVWASRQPDFAVEVDEANTVLERGRFFERGIIEWGAHRLGAVQIDAGIPLTEPGLAGPFPWLSTRPDGGMHFADKPPCLVEAKASDNEGFIVDGVEDVPEFYVVQALAQLSCVPHIDRVLVPAYLPIRRQFVTPFVHRDNEVIRAMLDRVNDWHYRHLDPHGPKEVPPVDASDACSEYLKKKFPAVKRDIREADEIEALLIGQFASVKAELKRWKDAEEDLKNKVRSAIGDAAGIQVKGGPRVTCNPVSGAWRIDGDALRSKFPDVYKAVAKKGEDRRDLRLWPAK